MLIVKHKIKNKNQRIIFFFFGIFLTFSMISKKKIFTSQETCFFVQVNTHEKKKILLSVLFFSSIRPQRKK